MTFTIRPGPTRKTNRKSSAGFLFLSKPETKKEAPAAAAAITPSASGTSVPYLYRNRTNGLSPNFQFFKTGSYRSDWTLISMSKIQKGTVITIKAANIIRFRAALFSIIHHPVYNQNRPCFKQGPALPAFQVYNIWIQLQDFPLFLSRTFQKAR